MLVSMRTLSSRYLTLFTLLLKSNKQSYKHYSQARSLLNMNEVFLRYEEGSDSFAVSLRYINPDLKLDRQFNFNRKVDECISNFLTRVDSNITFHAEKKLKRRSKKKDTVSLNNIVDNMKNKTVHFVRNDSILDGDVTCRSILEDPSNVKLIIFDTEYILRKNVPCVKKLKLPESILVGFPTYPTFESSNADKEKSTFNWYKQNEKTWIHVGMGYLYTPSISDIGCKLKITCTPKNDTQSGPTTEVVSKKDVEAGPGYCPFETRHAFTNSKLSGKSFRVATYNILANVYSETDLSKDVLYPYCPQYALSMDYRKLLILKELIGYNADIICLQEVDSKVYENDLVPSLHSLNYDSIYNLKNDLREGLAIFYNQERFDKLSCSYSVIGQNTDLAEFNSTWSQIQNENVKQTFQNRSTIIQTTVLQSKENLEILVVGNTHLYFKPEADHIRLLQAYYGLTYLQTFANEMKQRAIDSQNPKCNVSIIFCGDFNSVPENGVYQLMTQKYIPEDCADWKSAPNEHVQNVSLKHDCNLASACGTPEYTNYTATFSGCLDYIFYEKDYLEVQQVIPMPSHEELSANTAIPSVVFPSDHISLCADLKWTK